MLTATAANAQTVARSLLALKAAHLGRGPVEADCAGGTALFYAPFGVTVPLPAAYSPHWWETWPSRMLDHIEQVLRWDRVTGPDLVLDLCLFRVIPESMGGRGYGEHVGVLIGGGRMFHAWEGRFEITAVEGHWIKRVVRAYRPPGVRHCPPPSPSSQEPRSAAGAPPSQALSPAPGSVPRRYWPGS